jgi:hypothetical protein
MLLHANVIKKSDFMSFIADLHALVFLNIQSALPTGLGMHF